MATDCKDCPLRRKDAFVNLKDAELRHVQKFKSGEMTIDPGTPILMQGSASPQLFTALRGMGLRFVTLPNGKRQVINFVFPGDFIGLQSALLGEMKHSFQAVTRMTLCVFDRTEFWNFLKQHPERAYAVTWMAACEEHFLGNALTSLGQRDAMERIAWALHRLYQRGETLGMTRNGKMPLPFRQQDLADAMGLSLVHTNKTLARFRDRQIATWSDGSLHINDEEKLAEIAMIDHDEPDAGPRPLL